MISDLTDEPVNKIRHHLTHQSTSSTILLYNSEFQKNQMPFSCTVVRIVWLRGRVGILECSRLDAAFGDECGSTHGGGAGVTVADKVSEPLASEASLSRRRDVVVVQCPFAHEAHPSGYNPIEDEFGVFWTSEILFEKGIGGPDLL